MTAEFNPPASHELGAQDQSLHTHVYTIVSAIGHSTSRLAAVLTLASFPKEEPVTVRQLNSRLTGVELKRIADMPLPDLPIEGQIFRLLRDEALSLVTMKRVEDVVGRYHGGVLTPYGHSIGVAIAGELLSLEKDSPQPGFLNAALSNSYLNRMNPRLPMYRRLLKGAARVSELHEATGAPRQRLYTITDDLIASGILFKQTATSEQVFTRAADYRYKLLDPVSRNHTKRELQAAYDVVAELRLEGVSQAAGDLILKRICARLPDLPPKELWKAFTDHTYDKRDHCVEKIVSPKAAAANPIGLTESARPYIERLIQGMDMIGGKGEKAEAFRRRARRRAYDIVGSQPLLERLIMQGSSHKDTSEAWKPLVKNLMSQGDISLPDLYQALVAATGSRINYLELKGVVKSLASDDPPLLSSKGETIPPHRGKAAVTRTTGAPATGSNHSQLNMQEEPGVKKTLRGEGSPATGTSLKESVYETVSLMGSNYQALIALLGIASFPPDQPVTIRQLNSRFVNVGRTPVGELPIDYRLYERIFRRAGMITLHDVGRRARGAVLTQYGRSIGTAMAGSLLSLELIAPHKDFLKLALGTNGTSHVNPRLLMYDKMLEGAIDIGELYRSIPMHRSAMSFLISEMSKSNIIYNKNAQIDPYDEAAQHVYDLLSNPSTGTPKQHEQRAVIETINILRAEGILRATGTLVLRRACEQYPDIPPSQIWYCITSSACQDRNDWIKQVTAPARKTYRTLALAESVQPHIAQLMRIINLLGDEGGHAEAFRQRLTQRGQQLLASPVAVHRFVGYKIDRFMAGKRRQTTRR